MLARLRLSLATLLFAFAPLCVHADVPTPDFDLALGSDLTGACDETMSLSPDRVDLEKYESARAAQAKIQKAEEWYGKDYSFEEALAIVERHLELSSPEMVEVYRGWIKTVIEDQGLLMVREAKATKMKAQSFWNLGFLRHFSFNESFRNAKYVIHWNRKTIENAYHLFELEQKVIRFLGRARYDDISGIKVFTRKSKRYLKDNILLARDQLVLQYYLKGRKGVDPSTAAVFKESMGLMKNWSLGMLWPGNRTPTKLKPIYAWIIDQYGSDGLARYLFAKYGPATALGFSVNWFYKAKILFTLPLTIMYVDRAHDIYTYYKHAAQIEFASPAQQNEAKKILDVMTTDPFKVLDQTRKELDEAPVLNTDPDLNNNVSDTLQKQLEVPGMTQKERDELRKLTDEIEKELKLEFKPQTNRDP